MHPLTVLFLINTVQAALLIRQLSLLLIFNMDHGHAECRLIYFSETFIAFSLPIVDGSTLCKSVSTHTVKQFNYYLATPGNWP